MSIEEPSDKPDPDYFTVSVPALVNEFDKELKMAYWICAGIGQMVEDKETAQPFAAVGLIMRGMFNELGTDSKITPAAAKKLVARMKKAGASEQD